MGSAARAQAREQVILGVDPGLTRCGFGIVRMRADRRAAGFGLVGMGERVHALGGLLVAGPVQGGGWQVHATFPMRAPVQAESR